MYLWRITKIKYSYLPPSSPCNVRNRSNINIILGSEKHINTDLEHADKNSSENSDQCQPLILSFITATRHERSLSPDTQPVQLPLFCKSCQLAEVIYEPPEEIKKFHENDTTRYYISREMMNFILLQ